jgi:tetratricopeptide (TPR) repeat protein
MSTRSDLAELESLGLIHVAPDSEEAAYLFRHALTQDAAYASLVKQDRQRLNLIVGQTLENLYADRLEQIAPRLANHFDAAGDDARALKYFTLAGDRAAKQFANAEAIEHYTRALTIAKHTANLPNASSLLKHLYDQRGLALHSIANYHGALDNFTDMQTFAQQRGDRFLELHSLIEQAQMHAMFGPLLDPTVALKLGHQALTLNEQVQDGTAEARVNWVLMRAFAQTGLDPQQAVAYGERSIALARELKLEDQLAYSLNDIQYAYRSNLQIQRAVDALTEARQRWRVIGQQHMLADNLNQAALIEFYRGNFNEAEKLTNESLVISAATDNIIQFTLCHFVQTLIAYERGEFTAAFTAMQPAINSTNPIFAGIGMIKALILMELNSLDLAITQMAAAQNLTEQFHLEAIFGAALYGEKIRLALRQDDLSAAIEALTQARQLPNYGANVNEFLGGDQLLQGEIELALAQKQIDRAEAKCDRDMSIARTLGARRLLPAFLQLRAQIHQARGQLDQASESLEEARSIAESIGSRTGQLFALIDLINLEKQRGHDPARLLDQARPLARFLIDQCPDHLRAGFEAKLNSSL